MAASSSSAAAKSPSPVPRITPTSGASEQRARTAAAASSIRVISSLAMLPFPLLDRRREPFLRLGLPESFDFDRLAARRRASLDANRARLHSQRLREQLHQRAVGASIFRRRAHRHLQRAVGPKAQHLIAPRAGPEAHREQRHPMRSARSRIEPTTNIFTKISTSIAMNGAKSIPPNVVGNNLRIGAQTRSETRSRNWMIGFDGSGLTHDNNAFTKITISRPLRTMSRIVAIARSRLPITNIVPPFS